jgi:AcrR family transcriptional regulator
MERAMLRLSGELGYERASVGAVVARSGSNLAGFYRAYSGKADCYEAAYDAAATSLCARLVDACTAAADWRAGVKSALLELDAFAAEDAPFAAGVIVQVHVVGGPALERRAQIVDRLARVVDRGRFEGPRRPNAATARFVVESIEATVVRSLAEGTALREALPGLLFLAVASYFDAAEAARQVRGWPGGR